MEKVLICAPTAAAKNYCAAEWLSNINAFTYPNFQVVVFDNTNDDGENAAHLRKLAQDLCVKFEFHVFWIKDRGYSSLMSKLTDSHNGCRLYTLQNRYKHMLHLETDVMPPKDVIERLLSHKKLVAGALYYRDEGKSRKLMVQKHVQRAYNNLLAMNMLPNEDVNFIDGNLKKVAHVGLGAVMIATSVFKDIVFRFKHGLDAAPDTFFAEDCFVNGIDIWADTSLICEHRNTAWGHYGIDYN